MLLGSVAKSIIGHKAEDLWDGSYAEVSIMMFVLCRLMIIHFCETKTILWIDFDTQIEDPEILPAPIQDLVGKSFCFGLSITSDNVTNGSGNYIVLEVCSGDKVLSIETVSEAISDIGTTSSTMSSAPVSLLETGVFIYYYNITKSFLLQTDINFYFIILVHAVGYKLIRRS